MTSIINNYVLAVFDCVQQFWQYNFWLTFPSGVVNTAASRDFSGDVRSKFCR